VLLGLALDLVEPLLFLDELLAVMLVAKSAIRAIGATDLARQEHARPALARGMEVVSLRRSASMFCVKVGATWRAWNALALEDHFDLICGRRSGP